MPEGTQDPRVSVHSYIRRLQSTSACVITNMLHFLVLQKSAQNLLLVSQLLYIVMVLIVIVGVYHVVVRAAPIPGICTGIGLIPAFLVVLELVRYVTEVPNMRISCNC